ncbi:alpha-glucosidase C-terminal domain-containing protein [Lacrimispora sp. NSJ-141]|uniref:Alpha-amylase n=1 Tax=Lientehia hominis TaxID=2897778 RepID=A0AAP2RK52_9FIRM|nr:alpha-amylase family glycosyl hydrolase [Lientehia hominis]MCD2493507.1 alpha-glucosidase C-terminal domain-containing protein [Lientehia hominis]
MSAWYDNSVFYHMYPLGMTGAPKENREEQTEGRFGQLDAWIPHIKELGASAIYIGPLFESTTHGYDTRDFRLVDRRLGTNEDFRKFVSLCHESGIRVVVDSVFNHTGREFFAFRDIQKKRDGSPYRDWYKNVNFWQSSPLGDSFTYEAWQGHYELAALNLRNPSVRDYLLDAVSFWVQEFDIDGIRLDCANVLDFDFMKALRSHCDRLKPEFWLMGEVIHGDYSRWANESMLHSVTNYELHKGLYSGHNDYNCFEIAHTIRRQSQQNGGIYRNINLYTFVDNHDEDRIMSKLKNKNHITTVYTMLFTLPGIPSIYYGSEWGIDGARTPYCDDMLRPAISPDQFPEYHTGLTDCIARLARIHKAHPALCTGTYRELFLTNRQYAFCRSSENEHIITAVNIDDGDADLSFSLPMEGSRTVDLQTGENLLIENNHLSLHLAGCESKILEIVG